MVERLAEFFWHQQYGVQRTNFSNVRILYKEDGSAMRVIVIFDMESEIGFSVEQYGHILDQVKKAYAEKGYVDVEVLSVICTSQIEEVKEFCEWGHYTHWVVNPITNRLIIFENQPHTFVDVKNQLESILIGPLYKVNPEYQKPVSKNREFYGFQESTNSFKRRLAGKPVFTVSLIVINVVIFLLMKLTESDSMLYTIFGYVEDPQASTRQYLEWGATSYSYIMEGHEYYRYFTAMFLHAGFEHLANNMVVLAIVGYMLETNFGSARFLIIYLISGVLANVGSVFYFHEIGENIVGLGASGAIFGIIGAFAYLVVRYRGRGFDISATRFMLFLGITVYSGFQAQENVDNVAHIVGFFIGILTCVVLDIIRRNRRVRRC